MALEPLSRDRLIRGGALAIRGLLHEEDPVEISRVGAVPGHRFPQPGSATARGVERSRPFANLALLLVFACLAGLLAHFSGGCSDAPGMLPSGFRSSTGGVERFRNGPVGPEQDVMRFDARRIHSMSVAFTITAGALAGGAFQRPASSGADSHWYLWCSQPRVWPEARQFALAVGGDLASLETSDERAWIYAQPGRPSGYLAGACQSSAADAPAEGWSWLTGVAIAAGDMSADDCGAEGTEEHRQDYLEVAGNLLGDIHPGGPNLCGSDSGQRPFLIEWSADCNADGKVDYGQIRRGELADFNGNNIPDCCEGPTTCCPTDLNDDGQVNGADLGALVAFWGPNPSYPRADITGDGTVNGSDLGLLLSAWGACGQ